MEGQTENDFGTAGEKMVKYREAIVCACQELFESIIDTVQSLAQDLPLNNDVKKRLTESFDKALQKFARKMQVAHGDFTNEPVKSPVKSEESQSCQLHLQYVSVEDLPSRIEEDVSVEGSEHVLDNSMISSDLAFEPSDIKQDLECLETSDDQLTIAEVEHSDGGDCDDEVDISDTEIGNNDMSETLEETADEKTETCDVLLEDPLYIPESRARGRSSKGSSEGTRKTCEICSETFSNIGNLNRHKTRKHSSSVSHLNDSTAWENDARQRRGENASKPATASCALCGETLSSQSNLRRHMRRKHSALPAGARDSTAVSAEHKAAGSGYNQVEASVACTMCEATFMDDAILAKHVEQKHQSASDNLNRSIISSTDDRYSENESETISRDVTDFHCDICDTSYSSRSNLNKHMRIKHSSGFTVKNTQAQKVCELCDESFCSNGSLKRHIQRKHTVGPMDDQDLPETKPQPAPRLVCRACGETFSSSSSLNRHIKRKHMPRDPHHTAGPQRKEVCEICASTFASVGNLRRHIIQVHRHVSEGVNLLKCSVCKETLSSSSNLLRHMRRKHMVRSNTPMDGLRYECKICKETFESSDLLGEHAQSCFFACLECEKTFTRREYFNKHMVTHTGTRSYLCSFCPKRFGRSDILKAHESSIHGVNCRFRCDQCGTAYSSAFKLKVHKARRHTGQRDFTCEFCARAFFTMEELKVHIVARHGVKTKFHCQLCHRFFALQSLLRTHMKIKHDRSEVHKCTQCEKSFYSKTSVRQHMKTHTREENYVCTICKASFVWGSSLSQHLASAHNQGGVYKCDQCEREYRSKNQLRSHKKTKHDPKQIHVCGLCNTTCSTKGTLTRHIRRKHVGQGDEALNPPSHGACSRVEDHSMGSLPPVQNNPFNFLPYPTEHLTTLR